MKKTIQLIIILSILIISGCAQNSIETHKITSVKIQSIEPSHYAGDVSAQVNYYIDANFDKVNGVAECYANKDGLRVEPKEGIYFEIDPGVSSININIRECESCGIQLCCKAFEQNFICSNTYTYNNE